MNAQTFERLEYDKVKQLLREHAVSGLGKRLIDGLLPSARRQAVADQVRETAEARAILDAAGHVPLHGLSDVTDHMDRLAKGAVLDPAALVSIADLLRGCRKIRTFMARFHDIAPLVSGYAGAITELPELEEQVEVCIENGRVSDAASQRLARVRTQIDVVNSRIRDKVNSYLTSSRYRECLQENLVTMKDDRYCLPIKVTHRHQIDGTVVATSGSGSTVFIEPAAVRELTNELKVLRGQEEAEEYQVLAMLSGELGACYQAIQINIETMAAYDFAFAKGRLARSMGAVEPVIAADSRIVIRDGRHPLLGDRAVPLSFHIGKDYRTLLITGPNTGGKTVALKTVGLFVLMAQSGLHLPAAPGTEVGVFDRVLVDIGDKQSIEQSLSTFSGHMGNIVSILNEAGRGSLVLIDEIGTGTDPAEGAALGAAVLDELYDSGAVTVATTHYGDLKRFSQTHAGFRNGCMDFDPETLKPLYRLHIGRAGQSNGFWIAERLGMKPGTLAKARAFRDRVPESSAEEEKEASGGFDTDDIMELPPIAEKPLAQAQVSETPSPVRSLQIGDSVHISSLNEKGVLCELPDSRGDAVVLVRGNRVRVNHKRLSLHIAREDLYPEGYDLNIVLLSKSDRRLVHDMERKHVKGAVRVIDGDEAGR